MKTNTEKDEKICRNWMCKRTLVGESKSGLCPDCINTYGSMAAVIVAIGIGGIIKLGRGWVLKNGGKVAKGAFGVIKLFS
jgi:hypothetical protein